jgi:hypothetical protein
MPVPMRGQDGAGLVGRLGEDDTGRFVSAADGANVAARLQLDDGGHSLSYVCTDPWVPRRGRERPVFGAIDEADGKDSAFAAMHDPRDVLPMYEAALKKRSAILGHCPLLADSTMRHADALEPTHCVNRHEERQNLPASATAAAIPSALLACERQPRGYAGAGGGYALTPAPIDEPRARATRL